ncbi:MAG: ABC transporter substrate-binding protein [Synergistetes bacterium]|nr:ABC transporter substrate-binding protein [Synergistota bacterium]
MGSALAAGVVRLGAVLPMTGAVAAYGQQTWSGIKLAMKLYPTVLGEKIKVVLVDNKSDKVESANAASRLAKEEKVVAVIGAVASSNSLAAGPILEKAHIPMVTPASTNPLVTQGKHYIFRVCFIDPFQGKVAAVYARKVLHAKTAAMLIDRAQDYCVGLANFFKKAFTKMGGKIVAVTYAQTGDQDFTAQLTAIKRKHPDVIYIPNYYTEDALVLKQARELGIKAHFISGDGAQADALWKVGGKAVVGLAFTTHFAEKAVTTKLGKQFVKEYYKVYEKSPPALAALGFDAYMIIRDAIARAKSANPEKIRSALSATKGFKGVTGIINIDEHGNAVKSAVMEKVVWNEKANKGEFKFVTVINP